MKKNKRVLFISMIMLLVLCTSATYYAKSLTVKISATNNIEKSKTGKFSTSIEYDGWFYTGYYNIEISPNYKVNDITSTSFRESTTTFKYVKSGSLIKSPVWKFSKSFNSIISSTKKVNGVLYATTTGSSLPLACGTGSGHDIDKNKCIYRTIVN